MPPGAGDIVLFGAAPKTSDYYVGRVWLHGWVTTAAPLVLNLDVYAYAPPNRVVWGDGTNQEAAAFTVATAPTGGAPGRYNITHNYGTNKPAPRDGYVEAGVRERFSVFLGDVPVWDPDKRDFIKTQSERWAEERREAADIQRQMATPGR